MSLHVHRVLLIEPEQTPPPYARALEERGHQVLRASTAADALSLCTQQPELIVLDLQPLRERIELGRRLRQRTRAPLLALLGPAELQEAEAALGLGSREYLLKPVDPDELVGQVEVLLMSGGAYPQTQASKPISVGNLEIDLEGYRLLRNGQVVHLTRTEWGLLELLVRNAGSVLPHRTLLQRVWGDNYSRESGYLHVFVSRLRRKLEEDPSSPRYLISEPGIGYRFAQSAPASPVEQPRPTIPEAPAPRPLNLPAQTTSLVGRTSEVEVARGLLRSSDVRLLTLTGPGGIGKTRLSLKIAADLADEFEHGVHFVSLASIHDPDLVPLTIAQLLGVKEVGGELLQETLKSYLRDRQLLLVLDNFEQILAAAPLVAELLVAAPDLKVLVTSRAVLHLYGEQEFPVPPLTLPDLEQLPAFEQLSQNEAVQLFVERARTVSLHFNLTKENAPAIATICHRLDGLPLAIELAAARSKLLSPQAMLSRLTSRLSLLIHGAEDVPARQQTLRATIDWSYELLLDDEKALFARLAVFEAGYTLDAAEAITSVLPGEKVINVLDGMASLLDKSLLRRIGPIDDEPRFMMLETVREYAFERLRASGGEGALLEQHTSYYLDLAELAEPELTGTNQALWLERLEGQHHNLRAVIQRSLARQEPEVALRMCRALWKFWRIHSHQSEGLRWTEAALALPQSEPSTARAHALYGAGWMAFDHGDPVKTRNYFEESLTLARQLGDKQTIAEALHGVGKMAETDGDRARAIAHFEESLALSRELRHKEGIAWSLDHLGCSVLTQREYARAKALCEESIGIFRELGHKWGIAISLLHLGLAVLNLGDSRRAMTVLEECLQLFHELGNRLNIAWPLSHMGRAMLEQGNIPRAIQLFRESLEIFYELGHQSNIASLLSHLGRAALEQGDLAGTQALFEESLNIFRQIDDDEGSAYALYHLALARERSGDLAQARRLVEESLALYGQSGDPVGRAVVLELLAGLAEQDGTPERAVLLRDQASALNIQAHGSLWFMDRPL